MPPSSSSRFHWIIFWFLCGFLILLVISGYWWLIPGLAVTSDASPAQQRYLAAASMLVLIIILALLLSVAILLLGHARHRTGRDTSKRHVTDYPDAWAESARRLKVPPRDQDDDGENNRPDDSGLNDGSGSNA